MKLKTLFAIAATLFFFAGCMKNNNEATITKTINASLKQNGSYTVQLPGNKSSSDYMISKATSHSIISQISTDASGNSVYQYTPIKDYLGSDVVIISSSGSHCCDKNHQKSANSGGDMMENNQDMHSKSGMVITINLDIVKEITK